MSSPSGSFLIFFARDTLTTSRSLSSGGARFPALDSVLTEREDSVDCLGDGVSGSGSIVMGWMLRAGLSMVCLGLGGCSWTWSGGRWKLSVVVASVESSCGGFWGSVCWGSGSGSGSGWESEAVDGWILGDWRTVRFIVNTPLFVAVVFAGDFAMPFLEVRLNVFRHLPRFAISDVFLAGDFPLRSMGSSSGEECLGDCLLTFGGDVFWPFSGNLVAGDLVGGEAFWVIGRDFEAEATTLLAVCGDVLDLVTPVLDAGPVLFLAVPFLAVLAVLLTATARRDFWPSPLDCSSRERAAAPHDSLIVTTVEKGVLLESLVLSLSYDAYWPLTRPLKLLSELGFLRK